MHIDRGGSALGKRVLLIEDEPNIIEAIRFILSRDGFVVDTHSDGATALQAVHSRAPDLVVLDVMLPNRSGIDILRDLRELAERYGASRFMTKPFSNSEVLNSVRELTAP